jgi:hypothetical protein
MALVGIAVPLKIVLTTVVPTRPAALTVVFGAAIADGVIARVVAIAIAIRDLLPFMGIPFSIGETKSEPVKKVGK